MSRREEEKRKSLDALARIASQAKAHTYATPKPAAPPPPPKPVLPKKSAVVPAPPRADADADRKRRRQMQERADKLAEERALRERRAGELARNRNLAWRGMDPGQMGAGIRRTAFDRVEPSTAQKIDDVLGAPREKEGRAKQRDRGRRQG